MTVLLPMAQNLFAAFREEAVAGYAHDSVLAGRWPQTGALVRAHEEFDRLLPLGLQTPGHDVYEILDRVGGQVVGALWFAEVLSGPNDCSRSGFVYNVRVRPEFRGHGHARAALEQVELIANERGLTSIGLHVFGFNLGAQALYRSLGYGITGMNMRKPLRPPTG